MNAKLTTLSLATMLIAAPALAVELIGQVESKNRQSVVAEVNGVVESANFEPGDKVDQNALLANIKTQNFDFELSKKQAGLELAQADLHLKQTTFERFQELVRKNSLSANDLDTAKAEYLNAKANLQLAEIELEQAKQNLDDTKVTSTMGGFIVSRSAEEGAWVNQGDLLYQLVNIDTVTIKLLASEYDMTSLNVGQAIEVWSETEPSKKIQSVVKRIGVEMDATAHAYPIEVEINNHEYSLKPGMSIYASTDITESNQ